MNKDNKFYVYVEKKDGIYNPENVRFTVEQRGEWEKKEILGPVPDSVIGKMTYCEFCHKWVLSAVHKGNVRGIDIEQYKLSDNEKVLILVLESPHKDEFDDNLKPILPAQGITGRNIENLIGTRNFVDILDKEYEYVVLLVNAVQYQTSCAYVFGNMNTKVRNKVFEHLFKEEGLKEDFLSRIQKHNKGNYDIIINCCTEGLRPLVKECLCKLSLKKGQDYHPSFWWTYKQYKKRSIETKKEV